MPEPRNPDYQRDEVPSDVADEQIVERDLPEAQIPGLPLSRDERLAKFRDCCEGALGADAVEQVIERVEALDSAASVAPLMDLVCKATPVFPE